MAAKSVGLALASKRVEAMVDQAMTKADDECWSTRSVVSCFRLARHEPGRDEILITVGGTARVCILLANYCEPIAAQSRHGRTQGYLSFV